jgi:triphosphoribosyl-dephospho-CoA synthase
MTPTAAEGRRTIVPAAHDLVTAAQLACLLEASAPKPGNVSPGRRFGDMGYEDFLASALALADPLRHAPESSLGSTIRRAVEATARWTAVNTNLGIVLLLVPLVRAGMRRVAVDETTSLDVETLRADVRAVLAQTTLEDAREVYDAIRRAAPGGLGRADEQDVAQAPTVSLIETMKLAADRDGIAHEYASGFQTTFAIGYPAIRSARNDGLPWDDAVVETFLALLAARHDTHIARRAGLDAATDVSARAAQVLSAGGVRTDAGRGMIDTMHQDLSRRRSLLNPGTTADLTAAAIFVLLATGGWPSGRATT